MSDEECKHEVWLESTDINEGGTVTRVTRMCVNCGKILPNEEER